MTSVGVPLAVPLGWSHGQRLDRSGAMPGATTAGTLCRRGGRL